MNDPTAAIVKFLSDEFIGKTEIMTVYDSDPDLIPIFDLPCITVEKPSDRSEYGATGYQDVTEEIMVKVIIDKQDDWSEDVDHAKHTMKKLRQIIEARTADGRSYAPNTIRYALMNRLEIAAVALDVNLAVDYGVTARNGGELVTAEAHITITCQYSMRSATR